VIDASRALTKGQMDFNADSMKEGEICTKLLSEHLMKVIIWETKIKKI
jgi:hypothetical protein